MLLELFDYLTHRFDPGNYRLVMTILVKNEADIIEANIRTHASLGVDAFVVMDNGSDDGTREILETLQSEFEINVIDETGLYQQSKWMKKLARVAKEEMKADWVINNDADEFWIPQSDRSLKEILAFKGDVITCHRYNMLLDPATQKGDFFDSIHRVDNPIYYRKDTQLQEQKVSIVLTKNAPKVIVNPHGLFLIRGGNHKALHIANVKDYHRHYDKIKRFGEIVVFHYPIRSYAQFEKNIRNRKNLLESGKSIKMGPHYRRWVGCCNEGVLPKEFEHFVFDQAEIEVLSRYGIVCEDASIKEKIIRAKESK